jgi:hypothetical protein
MAENAEKGSGQRFLALLSANLARQFSPIAEGTEPVIKDLLARAAKDPKFAPWATRAGDRPVPPPVAFRAFDPQHPPEFPAHLEAPLKAIANVVEKAAPLGLPVEFLQVYCGVPGAKQAADIMRKHPTMLGRIKFALAGPPPRDAGEFVRKATKALHGVFGDLIATDPVLNRYLPADVARESRGIIPPKAATRPDHPGQSARSPTPGWVAEFAERFPTPAEREYGRLIGIWPPPDGPPTDSWPTSGPKPDHPGGGGGGPRPQLPSRSLPPVIERLNKASKGGWLVSPDYALGYDDLLPHRAAARNPSLYDRVAGEHLKVQPPGVRQRITVDVLKGVGGPRVAMGRGASFSRLRGFHRVGGADPDPTESGRSVGWDRFPPRGPELP